ncbi:MAG: hypothetical protein HQL63_11465 [Magnetococcales bacterium]|nr:hypothetical protein [Magnetococcales bacterium]MBF0322396.1 hypothetical protein [Magnetococcales bacterium]
MRNLARIAMIATMALAALPGGLQAEETDHSKGRSTKRTILFNDGSKLKIQDGVPQLSVQDPRGRWHTTYDRKSALPFGNAPPGTFSYTRPHTPRWRCDLYNNCVYY